MSVSKHSDQQHRTGKTEHKGSDDSHHDEIVAALKAIAKEQKRANDEAERDSHPKPFWKMPKEGWLEFSTTVAIILATIVAIVAVVVSCSDAGKQRRLMQKQLNVMETTNAISISQLAADLTVSWSGGTRTDNGAQFWYVTAQVENTAPTKATDFRGWTAGHLFVPEPPTNYNFFPPGTRPTNGPLIIRHGGGIVMQSLIISKAQLDVMFQGTGRYVAWLYAEYRDAFQPVGHLHHIWECVTVIPSHTPDGNVEFAFGIDPPSCSRSD